MVDLNSLVIFARVIEANSFSEAARRLKMPTSTVSRRVAELEHDLGVRLIERSTRSLRLTDVGAEIFDQAQHGAELSRAIQNIASNHQSSVSGTLRIFAPPTISDSVLAPLTVAFQAAYPDIRVQIFVTERVVDQIAEGADLAFRVGQVRDPSLTAYRLLTYRHQLVASPAYLERHPSPESPQDLSEHRLLAFSSWKPENTWSFAAAIRQEAKEQGAETITFQPYLAMNEFAGLVTALLAGAGIGDLPPIVQPDLLRDGHLVEVMPEWHFRTFSLSVVHINKPFISQAVRVFKNFALKMVPTLFPSLPT